MDPLRQFTSFIRVRLSASDAHYGGQLIDGAHMLSLFGDVATELAILCDGDEGLLVLLKSVGGLPKSVVLHGV
jgi:3-aminobutyryl-CoA ammonia-lyase